MRAKLSAPVALIIMIVGIILSYAVLHSNGWSWNGNLALATVYSQLPVFSRVLVVVGIVLSAFGLGAWLQALSGRQSRGDA